VLMMPGLLAGAASERRIGAVAPPPAAPAPQLNAVPEPGIDAPPALPPPPLIR
jgi:hypothetical protein